VLPGAFAKPDCSQLDAVLAAVKAWPGEATVCHRHATASLDGVCAWRHRSGRSGRRNGTAVEQRNGKKKWPVSLFDLKARFFVPTHALLLASCRDAVKAGHCAAPAA
jgi:hypothetical protein